MNQETGDQWAKLLLRLDEQPNALQATLKNEAEKLSRWMRGMYVSSAHLYGSMERSQCLYRNPDPASSIDITRASEARNDLPSGRGFILSSSRLRVRSRLFILGVFDH